MRLNSFTLTLSPSQSCVKQVSKAGMLRGKKDHQEDEQLPLKMRDAKTHMHSDQTHTCNTINLFLHTKQTEGLDYSKKL